VSQDLLHGLRGQAAEPFPTRQRLEAGIAELPVYLGNRWTLCDAALAAGVPLVEKIPDRSRDVPLTLKRRLLR